MTVPCYPAACYTPVDDLWIISCIYNPNSYQTKPLNYEKFIDRIDASGLNYLIVDCAFDGQPFNVKKSKHILQIRTPHVMWQKERLLNIAVAHLPEQCQKVAWLDCDVLFSNPDWAKETSEKLNYTKIVQPFQTAVRLPKGMDYYDGSGDCYESFGYRTKIDPMSVTTGRYELHGHTGFAWASHKDILKNNGLYDVCIAGTADHLMAHTFAGDWDSGCAKRVFGANTVFFEHYEAWSRKIYKDVRAETDYTEGMLMHLWHGEVTDRKYTERQKVLERFNFDPDKDILLNDKKCWQWQRENDELSDWAKNYFVLRKED